MGQDLSQIVPRAAEQCVDRISLHALQEVPAQQSVGFHVADFGLDGGSPPKVALQRVPELPRAADEHPAAFLAHAMALVSAIHKGLGRNLARQALHLIQLFVQRVPIVGIACAGANADDEALFVGHGQTDLYAELVGPVRLSLADALHFWCMQAVDLLLRLPGLAQDQFCEDHHAPMSLERFLRELSLHVAHHAPSHGFQAAQHLLRSLELLRLHVATMLLKGPIHQLPVALTQIQALLLCNAKHGRMHLPIEPRVRRMLHRLGLDGRIHDHLLEAALRDGFRCLARQDRDLEQLLDSGFPDPLTPAGHLSGVDRKGVPEELLAAKELPVGVLNPSSHHLLVRKIERVFQQLQARHQSRGNRGTTVVGAIHRTKFRGDGLPVDHLGQLHQLVIHIDGQLQPHRPDHGLLVRLHLWFGLHRYTRNRGFSPCFLVYHIELKFQKNTVKYGFLGLCRAD